MPLLAEMQCHGLAFDGQSFGKSNQKVENELMALVDTTNKDTPLHCTQGRRMGYHITAVLHATTPLLSDAEHPLSSLNLLCTIGCAAPRLCQHCWGSLSHHQS